MAHAAELVMLEEYRRRRDAPISRLAFVDAVQVGDETATTILAEAGSRIGRRLADLVNLFDPEVIVVGGEAV